MKKLEQLLCADTWLREGRSLRLTQASQYLIAVTNWVCCHSWLTRKSACASTPKASATRCASTWKPSLLPVTAQGGVASLARWPDVDIDVRQKF